MYRLGLAPPETLGRRFQYALLSLGVGAYRLEPGAGYAEFHDYTGYLRLVEEALGAIKSLEAGGGARRRALRECRVVRGVDCCRLHGGPGLYAAGKSDYKLLESAGLTSCRNPASKTGIAWNHAAVSYADAALSRRAPLTRRVDDLPWLAKATVFGKLRAPGGGVEGKRRGPTVDLDVLGSVLLGGAVAFLYRARLGDKRLEFYLVPGAPSASYARLRELMLQRGYDQSTVARAARLASMVPVSLDIALALALAEDVAERYGDAVELAAYEEVSSLERAAELVVVEPQRRPMVRSAMPLTTVLYLSYSKRSLSLAYRAALEAARSRVEGAGDLAGRCITAMYLQALSGGYADHLSACIRGLDAAAGTARDRGEPRLAHTLELLAASLARDYTRMPQGVGRVGGLPG